MELLFTLGNAAAAMLHLANGEERRAVRSLRRCAGFSLLLAVPWWATLGAGSRLRTMLQRASERLGGRGVSSRASDARGCASLLWLPVHALLMGGLTVLCCLSVLLMPFYVVFKLRQVRPP